MTSIRVHPGKNSNSRKAPVFFLAMVLAVWISGCRQSPQPPSNQSILLHVQNLNGEVRNELSVTPIKDTKSRPLPTNGGELLTAGIFKPDGTRFPDGLEVTWRLATKRTAGERLWIVTLDPERKEWLGTGETAIVSDSGTEAAGRVWHFSEIGLSDQQPLNLESPPLTQNSTGTTASQEDDDKAEKNTHIKASGWRFTKLATETKDLRDLNPQLIKTIAAEISQRVSEAEKSGKLDPIRQLFADYPFEKIEAVAKSKTRPLTDAQSLQLASFRRQMINTAMGEVTRQLSPDGQLTIGMLDSGNKTSGIASDVDQTVFVIPKDLALQRSPPVTEALVMERFAEAFEKIYGFPQARMGVETLNGADFFPDWRQKHTVAAFEEECDRVVGEKRKSTEAYRSEGQLKSQAEGRGYDSLQLHHQRVRDLQSTRERIENIQIDPTKSDSEKQSRIAEATARLLDTYQKSHPAASLDELEQRFHRDSPWTEIRWNESTAQFDASQLADPKNKVLATDPERGVKRFAFDGAWDNWVMFEHHAHNRPKYLGRSVAEGVGLLRKQPLGDRLTTYESEKMFAELGAAEIERFVNEIYRNLPQETRDRYVRCLIAAAKDRLKHKGTKNKATGADYTTKEIWQHYWPLIEEKEAQILKGASGSRDQMLLERARRAWEADAREMMIDNLLLTVMAPGEILKGQITAEEVAKVRRGSNKFPDALPEKLTAAAKKQLYHGFHSLISFDYARHLLSPDGRNGQRPPTPDLVQRLLDRVQAIDPELAVEVRRIAEDAAAKRITEEADRLLWGGTLLEVYENRQAIFDSIRKKMAERLNSLEADYRQAKARYDAGEYTPEKIGPRILNDLAERWNNLQLRDRLNSHSGSLKAQVAHAIGFRNVNVLIPEDGFERVEFDFRRANFDARQLARHLACRGNVDSVMQIWLAYVEGGSEAALHQAGFEVVANVPGVMHLISLKELLVDGRPDGAAILGTAMFVPAVGQAFILWNIGRTSVVLLGHFILDPLHEDDADKMYQGFLDQRSGFAGVERSQRPSLLEFVPVRITVKTKHDDQGQPMHDPQGNPVMEPVFAPYSRDEIVSTSDKPARADALVFEEDFDGLMKDGVLGGGDEWERQFEKLSNNIANPSENFEAKRLSMYYYYREHFGDELKRLLEPEGLSIEDPAAAEKLVTFFLLRIKHWVDATGEFSEYGENTLISRRFEDQELRRRIANRAAADLIQSYYLVRAVERDIDTEARHRRDAAIRSQAIETTFPVHDSYALEVDSEMALAASEIIDYRRVAARKAAPRIHVRPSVTAASEPGPDGKLKEVEKIRLLVSVVADPIEFPPFSYDGESTEYKIQVRWIRTPQGPVAEHVSAEVSVFGLQGQIGQTLTVPIGSTGSSLEAALLPNRLGKHQGRDVYANQIQITHPDFPELVKASANEPKQLVVYAALSPEGPFDRPVGSVALSELANARKVTPEMVEQGWLSEECLRMNTPLGRDALAQFDSTTKQILNSDHGAPYYQVAIRPIQPPSQASQPVGSDLHLSNICGPDPPELFFNLPNIRDGKPGLFTGYGFSKAESMDGDLSLIQFGLGPGNQPFLYPNVKFKVIFGDQTRFLVSQPMNRRTLGTWATGWAELAIPPQREPISKFKIETEWGGKQIIRDYEFGFDSKAWAALKAEREKLAAEHEQRWQTAVARGDFKNDSEAYFEKRKLEHEWKSQRIQCDFRAMIPTLQRLLEIKVRDFESRLGELKIALEKRGGKPSSAPGSDPRSAEVQFLQEIIADYGNLARLAVYVGDGPLFQETLTQQILPRRSKLCDLLESNLRIGELERIAKDHAWLAEVHFLFTGDRLEAQKFFQQAFELGTASQRDNWRNSNGPGWLSSNDFMSAENANNKSN